MKGVILGLTVLFLYGICDGAKIEAPNDVRSYYKKLDTKNKYTIDTCSDCKFVASELKNVINDPAKLDKLKLVLRLACDYLGGEEAQRCKNMVDNLEMFVHQLEPYLDDPAAFCKQLHLCSTDKISIVGRLNLIALKSVVRMAKQTPRNDILCDECLFAVTEANTMIQNPNFQQELKREFEQACKIIHKVEEQCNSLVEEYFPVFLQSLEALLGNPRQLCAQLQFCRGFSIPATRLFKPKMTAHLGLKKKISVISMFMAMLPQLETTQGQNAMCLLCEIGLTNMVDYVNKNQKTISIRLSDAVCNALPRDFQPNCIDFASMYSTSLLHMIINEMTPEQMCQNLDVCTNSSAVSLASMTATEKSAAVCDACHTFADFVSFEFKKPPFEQEITDIIKQQVCAVLPGDLGTQCRDSADQYVPLILLNLSEYLANPTFCKEIGLCDTNA